MLLLSGVLLVLGFVILGTTLVQLQGMDGGTERSQRDNVMRTAEELVAGLNQTIQDSMIVGETNTTSFKETLRGAEDSFRDNAVRAGLYASVQLVVDPPQDIYWRESRCMGYNPEASEGGIIVGWEAETFEESIAGAVYHIHLTDGKQSFRTDLYVKLLDCAKIEVFSHVLDAQPEPRFGIRDNHTYSRQTDDQFMNLTEEEDHENQIELQIGPTIRDTPFTQGWNQPDGIIEINSTNPAKYVSSGTSVTNCVRWQLDTPPIMQPGDELSDVEVTVKARHNKDASLLSPQNLYLRVYHPDSGLSSCNDITLNSPDINEQIPLDTEWQTHNIPVIGPSGAENWTYDEILDSRFYFHVTGTHNSGREIYIDYFNMTGGMLSFAGYRMDATFEWQTVPPIYEDHTLHLRYNVTNATEDERFHLMVRDGGVTGSPWTTLYDMTTTHGQGEWREVFLDEDENGTKLNDLVQNYPEFRIVDSMHEDNWPVLDRDSVRIDLMRLVSKLPT